MATPEVVLLGSSGFVGSHARSALERRGARVRDLPAPRIRCSTAAEARSWIDANPAAVTSLEAAFDGAAVIVNAAGLSDATNPDLPTLIGANAVMPSLVAAAARSIDARVVHVSTAATQGRSRVLDASTHLAPRSAYATSKALGEDLAHVERPTGLVIYRPAGVHGRGRAVTERVARLARKRILPVAAPGDWNAPHALIQNVADAIAYLALSREIPPRIVNHPSEGISVSDLLQFLGGEAPVQLPQPVARAILYAGLGAGRADPRLEAHTRRLEVLMFGQRQARSWLEDSDWSPPAGLDHWKRMPRP